MNEKEIIEWKRQCNKNVKKEKRMSESKKEGRPV